MAIFYVDAGAGDDTNPGTAAEPVASIGRAIELAAASTDSTGSIRVAEGVYRGAPERFPLLMPPGYELVGAGKDRTVIEFTGMTRTTTGPDPVSYWGGTALVAGSAVRDLTLRANPIPEMVTSCYGTLGIQAAVDGCVIEDVDVLAPELPEEHTGLLAVGEWLERGFTTSVVILGADVVYRRSRVSHTSAVRALRGGAPELSDLVLEQSQMVMSNDGRVQRCRWLDASVAGGASVIRAGGSLILGGGSPHIGPDNFIGRPDTPTLACTGGATPTIEDNVLATMYGGPAIEVRGGAAPRFLNNVVIAKWITSVVRIAVDASAGTMFEGNVFYGSEYHAADMIEVRAAADFGGGAAGSGGGNHLGAMDGSHDFVWDVIGDTVHARDNYWLRGDPGLQSEVSAGTTLDTAGALSEFLMPDVVLGLYRSAVREAYDVPWRR